MNTIKLDYILLYQGGGGGPKLQIPNNLAYLMAVVVLGTGAMTVGFPLNDYWRFSRLSGREFYNTVQGRDQRKV